jgi:nucleolar MIF4G domain-containing protein 1
VLGHRGFVLTVSVDTVSRPRRDRAHPQKNNGSRKETRKQDREEKKRRKAQYFSTVANPKRAATPPHPESPPPPPKRRRVAETSRSQPPEPIPGKRLSETSSGSVSRKPKVAVLNKTSKRPRDHPDASTLPRSRQDDEEDRYIALLEAKLSGKTSRKGTGYIRDIDKDGLGGE